MADIFGGILSGAYNLGMGALAHKYEQENMNSQFALNEKSAQNAMMRQKDWYNTYQSPSAIMKQIKEAGLSPSLLGANGLSGSAGTSVPQGGGAGMPSTSANAGAMNVDFAQARLMNAQADQIEGKNERGKAEIGQILADSGLKNASERLTRLQGDFQNISNYIGEATKEDTIWRIKEESKGACYATAKMLEDANKAGLEYDFMEKTFQTRLQQVKYDLFNSVMDVITKNAQVDNIKAHTKLIGQQVKESIERIQQGWFDLIIKGASAAKQMDYVDYEINTYLPKVLELQELGISTQKRGQIIGAIGGIICSGIGAAGLLGATAMKTAATKSAGLFITPPMFDEMNSMWFNPYTPTGIQ